MQTAEYAVMMARQFAAEDREMICYWYPAICLEVITTRKPWGQLVNEAIKAYREFLSRRDYGKWDKAHFAALLAYEIKPTAETVATVQALLKPVFDHYSKTLLAKRGNFDAVTHEWTDVEMEFCSPAAQKPENLHCCTELTESRRAELEIKLQPDFDASIHYLGFDA